MAHIHVTQGLDIPIKGKPFGEIRSLPIPRQLALVLRDFESIKFKVLVKKGDRVVTGQPLALDKQCPDRCFVSPATGVVSEIRRGLKRRLMDIVIDTDCDEEFIEHGTMDVGHATREEILGRLLQGGLFAHIRMRPYDQLADPARIPKAIFVKAVESAPFVPEAERQIQGFEKEFQLGLQALGKLSDGPVHLVFRQGSPSRAIFEARYVDKHTVSGPHPAANHSVHIHHIDPIRSAQECVWTVTVQDVICIGGLLLSGRYPTERIITIAGTGIQEERRGYFKARAGFPIATLLAGRNDKGDLRFISGDPLMGDEVEIDDFLGFYHHTFTVLHENHEREFLHFFRPGFNKFTASGAYITGHILSSGREYEFTTSQHGEERPFIDDTPYHRVMPMQIPTMHLVKAVICEDFDTAEQLGLLEVAAEDFALPTFVCPSKVEMVDIMQRALIRCAHAD